MANKFSDTSQLSHNAKKRKLVYLVCLCAIFLSIAKGIFTRQDLAGNDWGYFESLIHIACLGIVSWQLGADSKRSAQVIDLLEKESPIFLDVMFSRINADSGYYYTVLIKGADCLEAGFRNWQGDVLEPYPKWLKNSLKEYIKTEVWLIERKPVALRLNSSVIELVKVKDVYNCPT